MRGRYVDMGMQEIESSEEGVIMLLIAFTVAPEWKNPITVSSFSLVFKAPEFLFRR